MIRKFDKDLFKKKVKQAIKEKPKLDVDDKINKLLELDLNEFKEDITNILEKQYSGFGANIVNIFLEYIKYGNREDINCLFSDQNEDLNYSITYDNINQKNSNFKESDLDDCNQNFNSTDDILNEILNDVNILTTSTSSSSSNVSVSGDDSNISSKPQNPNDDDCNDGTVFLGYFN